MSLILSFPELRHLARFLGLLPQAVVRCRMDCSKLELQMVVATADAKRRPPKPGHYVRFSETSSAADRHYLLKLAETVGHYETIDAPPDIGRWSSISQVLRDWFPLLPQSPPEEGRQDLLVAVYEEGSLARIYESAPKDPQHPSEIHFLQGGAEDRCPRYAFTLPRAVSGRRWQIWLDEINREQMSGQSAAQLFYRLPSRSAAAEYYVEYGWVHPVAHLPDLHLPDDARWLLISSVDARVRDEASPRSAPLGLESKPTASASRKRKSSTANAAQSPSDLPVPPAAAAQRAGQTRPAQWIGVRFAQFKVSVNAVSSPAEMFDIQMPPLNRLVVADAYPQGRSRVSLPLRLRRVASANTADLRKLEFRIQDAKEKLLGLERERSMLVQREKRRFRLLLRFRESQPPANDALREPPMLPEQFQRFLHYSAQRLDQFLYAYHQADGRPGCHDVLTREPVYYEDVHYGLADDVYAQVDYWTDWEFNVFVHHDFELLPLVNDVHLQRAVLQAFQRTLGDSAPTSARCVLLHPREGDSLPAFDVSTVDLPDDAEHALPRVLTFLNETAPRAELEARRAAAEQLRTELSAHAARLQADVNQVETHLKDETARRLKGLREEWNRVAADVERNIASVQEQQTLVETIDSMLEDFAVRWTDFVACLFRLTDAIAGAKLGAMARLDDRYGKWRDAVVRLEAAQVDVCRQIDSIRHDMQQKMTQATTGRETTERELAANHAYFHGSIQPRSQQLLTEAQRHVADAQRMADETDAKQVQVAQLHRQATSLLGRTRTATEWLERHRASFGQLLDNARENVARSQKLLPALGALVDQTQHAVDDWRRQQQNVAQLEASASSAERSAAAQIAEAQTAVADAVQRSQGALAHLEEQRHLITAERERAEQELQGLRLAWKQWDDECRQLQSIRQEAEKVRNVIDAGGATRRDALEALHEAATRFQDHRQQRVAERLDELNRSIDDLKELANLEETLTLISPLREAARLQAELAAQYANGRSLSDAEYREIWKG